MCSELTHPRISRAYGESHTSSQQSSSLTGGMNSRTTLTRPGVVAAVAVLMLMGLVVAALVLWGQQSDAVASPPVTRAVLGEQDGVIGHEGAVSVYDDVPAVSNLDSDLLAAVRAAADAAAPPATATARALPAARMSSRARSSSSRLISSASALCRA